LPTHTAPQPAQPGHTVLLLARPLDPRRGCRTCGSQAQQVPATLRGLGSNGRSGHGRPIALRCISSHRPSPPLVTFPPRAAHWRPLRPAVEPHFQTPPTALPPCATRPPGPRRLRRRPLHKKGPTKDRASFSRPFPTRARRGTLRHARCPRSL
jgi:hypothetical protein